MPGTFLQWENPLKVHFKLGNNFKLKVTYESLISKIGCIYSRAVKQLHFFFQLLV